MTVPSEPTISTDKVLGGQVTVLQLQQGYRVAIDPIFLAAAVPFAASARAPEQILDLGAGNGVVGFCLMARNPDVRVLAVDRDADALARAQTAARLNHVEERFRSAKACIGNSPDFAAFRNFDQVVAIPVSALKGDNVVKRSKNTQWYKGLTLLDFLETVDVKVEKIVQ